MRVRLAASVEKSTLVEAKLDTVKDKDDKRKKIKELRDGKFTAPSLRAKLL
jgi:hypothetical protein